MPLHMWQQLVNGFVLGKMLYVICNMLKLLNEINNKTHIDTVFLYNCHLEIRAVSRAV